MKKSKIIIPALLSILACGSVIAGSTYALFTSESSVNVAISSGKVDIKAVIDGSITKKHQEWDSTKGKYEEVDNLLSGECTLDEEKQNLKLTNIAPGDKVSFKIKVENNSTINIKYRTVIKSLEDTGLFDGLKITINNEEYDGIALRSVYKNYESKEGSEEINVTIEMPLDAGNYYQNKSCTLSYAVEAIQANSNDGVYYVNPSNAQATLDKIKDEATIILEAGDYSTLYLRQDLNVSTRRSDLDKDDSYPGYYRAIKGLTIKAKEEANVNCEGIKVEAGLMWYNSAPASNQKEMGRENSGFISYLSLEDISIEGIKFNKKEQTPILLRDNDAGTKSSTLLVNGFIVKNCTGEGNGDDTLYNHFFEAGTGSNDKNFDDTNMNGLNNIALIGNTISNYRQSICFNNTSAVLNNLKVKNNTFTDYDKQIRTNVEHDASGDNVIQISNNVNKGKFIFTGNTINKIDGRFIRMNHLDSSSSITLSNNKIDDPIKYDPDGTDIVKFDTSGEAGFKVYDKNNEWIEGSFSTDLKTYKANGDITKFSTNPYAKN